MLTIAQVGAPSDVREVQDLLREYTAWAFTLHPDSGQAPTFQGLEQELATLPGIYAPPTGALLLARRDDQPAGCVALKGHDAAVAELKRLYVRPGFRGHAIGERLVASLVDEARRLGYRRLVLDSHKSMTSAHALYRAAGFRDVDAPGGFPEEMKPEVVFMAMAIM